MPGPGAPKFRPLADGQSFGTRKLTEVRTTVSADALPLHDRATVRRLLGLELFDSCGRRPLYLGVEMFPDGAGDRADCFLALIVVDPA